MQHLDLEQLARLEAGAAEAQRYFREHLAHPCEPCEQFLATHAGPGGLDGVADWLLYGQGRGGVSEGMDELELARIRRGLRTARASRLALAAGGMAAAALVLLLALPGRGGPAQGPSQLPEGIKGGAPGLTLELEAALESGTGALRPVEPKARLPAQGALVLRYHATERATAWLVQERGGRLEALGRFTLEPGRHPLLLPRGEVASLPLEGARGELRLWLVASLSHLPSVDDALHAVKNGRGDGLALAVLPLELTAPHP